MTTELKCSKLLSKALSFLFSVNMISFAVLASHVLVLLIVMQQYWYLQTVFFMNVTPVYKKTTELAYLFLAVKLGHSFKSSEDSYFFLFICFTILKSSINTYDKQQFLLVNTCCPIFLDSFQCM